MLSRAHACASDKPREEIEITMPDGNKRKGTSWETSPMDIAKEIAKSLSEKVVIAKVRDQPTCVHGLVLSLQPDYRSMGIFGTSSDRWKARVVCSSSTSIIRRAKRCSGTPLRMSWANRRSDITAVIYALALLRMMGSTMKWLCRIGGSRCAFYYKQTADTAPF